MAPKEDISAQQTIDPSKRIALLDRLAKGAATARTKPLSPETMKTREALMARDHYLEEPEFLEMVREAGLRPPKYGQKVTTGKMTAWIRKIGSTVPAYLRWSGEKNLTVFAKNCPDWPFRAWGIEVLVAKIEGKL